MLRSILIPVLIAIAYAIIQAVAASRAKKEREARLRRQGASRDIPTVAGPSPATLQTSTSPTVRPPRSQSPMPVAASSRLDELAARRKAQLEQLRQRQQSKQRSRGAPVRPSSPQTAPPTRPTSRTRVRPDIEEVKASREGLRANQAHSQQVRVAQEERVHEARRGAETGERAAVRRAAAERARRAAGARAREAASPEWATTPAALAPAAPTAAADTVKRSPAAAATSNRIRDVLINPASIRQVIVLKEILDPPVSVRF